MSNEQEEATKELTVEGLEDMPNTSLTDEEASKLDGARAIIETSDIEEQDSIYGEDGLELKDGKTIKVKVVTVQTKPFGNDVIGRDVTVKERFSLKKNPVTGNWAVSHHEKAKSQKLFNKYKINTFPEAHGKEMVVVKKVSGTGRPFLAFSL